MGDEIEDAGAKNMSSDEDFVLEDEESANKMPTPSQANKDGEDVEKKANVATQSTLPQKRKAEEANIIEESKQPAASPGVVNDDDDDPCSIAIQTAPPRFKKKRKKHSPVTELKSATVPQIVVSVPQTVATVVPQASLPKTPQGTQNIVHIPSGMKVVKEIKTVDPAVKTSASVNTTVPVSNTVTTNAVSVSRALPSSSVTQAAKNACTVRIHPPKRPAILSASTSSAAAPKPSPLVVVPSSQVSSATSAQAITVSKNLQSTAVTLNPQHLQSQARLSAALPAGVGKVMLVSSSGVPLQVLKTIPVSQTAIQGKTLSPSVLTTPGNTRVRIVSSSSSPSNPVGAVTLTSSSPLPKSATSQLPSSASAKLAVSVTPANLPNVLSTAKQASQVRTTSASAVHPPVLLVQRSGGVVPLTVKGGAIVMPAASKSQQVVVIRPSSALTSSTTSTTTLLSGAGISVLGNAQIAQTALGHKVILQGSTSLPHLEPKTVTVTGNKPVVQIAKTPLESKPSQLETTSQTLGNKPVLVTTTASPSIVTANKAATTSVTVASNTAVSDSKPTLPVLAVGNEQVVLGKEVYSELTAPNKQSSNVGSIPVCGTEVPETVTKILASKCDAVKRTVTQTAANVCSDAQTVGNVLPDAKTLAAVLQGTQTVTTVLPVTQTVTTVSPVTKTVATVLPVTQTEATVSPVTQKVASILPVTQMVATVAPVTQTVATVLPVTQAMATILPETGLEQTDEMCEDKSIPVVTINTNKNCQPENKADDNCNKATELDGNDKDTQNGCDPLVDLTCYETSVSDSAGCEESDDSAPNGLHPDLKTTLPCKLTETDVKLFNGSVSPDTECEEKQLDSAEQCHEITKQTTNGIVTNET